MKQSRFKNLSYRERKNKLISELRKKSNGILTEDEIERIVRSVDVNTQYSLELTHSPEKMEKELTLLWLTTPTLHYQYVKEHGNVLLGKAGFILIKQEWNKDEFPEDFTKRPSFLPQEKLVIKVEKYISYISPMYISKKQRIIIYLPE